MLFQYSIRYAIIIKQNAKNLQFLVLANVSLEKLRVLVLVNEDEFTLEIDRL